MNLNHQHEARYRLMGLQATLLCCRPRIRCLDWRGSQAQPRLHWQQRKTHCAAQQETQRLIHGRQKRQKKRLQGCHDHRCRCCPIGAGCLACLLRHRLALAKTCCHLSLWRRRPSHCHATENGCSPADCLPTHCCRQQRLQWLRTAPVASCYAEPLHRFPLQQHPEDQRDATIAVRGLRLRLLRQQQRQNFSCACPILLDQLQQRHCPGCCPVQPPLQAGAGAPARCEAPPWSAGGAAPAACADGQ